MKVLIAPDKFKGTLAAAQVCEAIAQGLLASEKSWQVRSLPLADGGDGTLDFFLTQPGCERVRADVHDALMRPIKADYAWLPETQTAFVEMAQASGLVRLRDEERNPLHTTTFGTGELIRDAVRRGAKKVLIGIGGSATTDGGAGVLCALGARLVDAVGNEVPPVGGELARVARVEWPERGPIDNDATFVAFCDVQNPFYGEHGAALVYGPQKGATPADVAALDNALRHWAMITQHYTGVDLQHVPGSGAGGGLAGGLQAWLGAELKPGIEVILDLAHFDEAAQWADVIVTGEGRVDDQTLNGKVVAGVWQRAKGKRVVVVCGQSHVQNFPVPVISLAEEFSLDYAMGHTADALVRMGERLVRTIRTG